MNLSSHLRQDLQKSEVLQAATAMWIDRPRRRSMAGKGLAMVKCAVVSSNSLDV